MKKPDRDDTSAWAAHNRSQLRYFRSLSLRRRMEAVEGMADLVRHFERMRAAGAFRPSPAGQPGVRPEVRESSVAYRSGRGRSEEERRDREERDRSVRDGPDEHPRKGGGDDSGGDRRES
jgi:hypothetical protein